MQVLHLKSKISPFNEPSRLNCRPCEVVKRVRRTSSSEDLAGGLAGVGRGEVADFAGLARVRPGEAVDFAGLARVLGLGEVVNFAGPAGVGISGAVDSTGLAGEGFFLVDFAGLAREGFRLRTCDFEGFPRTACDSAAPAR